MFNRLIKRYTDRKIEKYTYLKINGSEKETQKDIDKVLYRYRMKEGYIIYKEKQMGHRERKKQRKNDRKYDSKIQRQNIYIKIEGYIVYTDKEAVRYRMIEIQKNKDRKIYLIMIGVYIIYIIYNYKVRIQRKKDIEIERQEEIRKLGYKEI